MYCVVVPTTRGTVRLDAEAFKAKRKASFSSQVAFAKACGYSLSIVSFWELGERQPSTTALAAVAAALGVDPSEIAQIAVDA